MGRLVIAVVNFAPRNIAGFQSEVLVLGALPADGSIPLLRVDEGARRAIRSADGPHRLNRPILPGSMRISRLRAESGRCYCLPPEAQGGPEGRGQNRGRPAGRERQREPAAEAISRAGRLASPCAR